MEKKTLSGWPIRLRLPNELPMIAKFDERVDFDVAKKPIKMFMKNEEVLDEPEDPNIVKDSEYWKRKKQRRRSFRAKSLLVLEDSTKRIPNGPPMGLQYEGVLSNINLADSEGAATDTRAKARPKIKSLTEAPFKYAIMEVLTTASGTKEVCMTPVGDWFAFRKPSVTGQKLLDEVDEDFELKQQHDRSRLARYRRINKTLESTTRISEDAGDGEVDEEGLKVSSSGGYVLPSAFGRSMTKGLKAGTRRLQQRRHMDEAGVDIDAEKEFGDYCGGDYSKTFADDEEENVGREQAELEEKEDNFAAKEIVPIEAEDGSGGNFDSDEEDEEEEGDDVGGEGEGGDWSGILTDGGLSYSEREGMVSEDLEDSAKSYGRFLQRQAESEKLAAAKLEIDAEKAQDSVDESSSRKRQRVEFSGVSVAKDGDANMSVPAPNTFNGAAAAIPSAMKKQSMSAGPVLEQQSSSEAPSKVAAATRAKPSKQIGIEFELSEEGIKKYLISVGGKANPNALKEVFKPSVKEYNKQVGDNKAGLKLLIDILLKVTNNEDDPVVGKILKLKDMSLLQKN